MFGGLIVLLDFLILLLDDLCGYVYLIYGLFCLRFSGFVGDGVLAWLLCL